MSEVKLCDWDWCKLLKILLNVGMNIGLGGWQSWSGGWGMKVVKWRGGSLFRLKFLSFCPSDTPILSWWSSDGSGDWIDQFSLSLCLYPLSSVLLSPVLSPFVLSPPVVLAATQPLWLQLASFIICQQFSGDEAKGLVRGNYLDQSLFFFPLTLLFCLSLLLFSSHLFLIS